MNTAKIYRKLMSGIIAFALALLVGAGVSAIPVFAAGGTVYTCTVNRCYAHPVTGVIEDSGGEASYATGQGMVEGCVYPTGLFELTDDGQYYLTIKMSLIDYTSGHAFQVQNVGDSGWSDAAFGVTGSGSDNNGTTNDVCIQVPSENCVIRGSMYVEPMGRDVVFYLYPSDFAEGNSTDMNATMVTEASGGTTSSDTAGTTDSAGTTDNSASQNSGSVATPAAPLQSNSNSDSASGTSGTDSSQSAKKLESGIKEAAAPASDNTSKGTDSSTLDSAQGLSLSTKADTDKADTADSGSSKTKTIVTLTVCITCALLILIGVGAAIVYFFRKNWKRWGGSDDDDEDDNEEV